MARPNEEKSLRLSLLKTAQELDELIERNNKQGDLLMKDIESKVELITKTIGRQIYMLIGEPIEGKFLDLDMNWTDRDIAVNWMFHTFNHSENADSKYDTEYGGFLSFWIEDEDEDRYFKASCHSDTHGLRTNVILDDVKRTRTIQRYHEYLNRWISKYIYNGELKELIEDRYKKKLDLLDE